MSALVFIGRNTQVQQESFTKSIVIIPRGKADMKDLHEDWWVTGHASQFGGSTRELGRSRAMPSALVHRMIAQRRQSSASPIRGSSILMRCGKRNGREFIRSRNRAREKENRAETISNLRLLRAQRMAGTKSCRAIGSECRTGVSGATSRRRVAEERN